VTDVAKACKDFGFFTSKIFNNKTHLFRLSGFTTYSMTASYLVKVTALTANTDGKINRLVMVFAAPCSHDKSCQNLHPDTRTYPQYKSCNVTDFWLRSNLYRDTAQVPLKNILYRDSLPASIKLVPRHARLREKLYLDLQKPRHASLLSAVYRDPAHNRRAFLVTASRRSATPTNSTAGPLAVRRFNTIGP